MRVVYHCLESLLAARARPIVIQSLFMKVQGVGPEDAEITAYVSRLRTITQSGGQIQRVQVYTVARPPAESFVTALESERVREIAARITRELNIPADAFC